MNKKLMRDIALAVIVVFGITIYAYPLIFNPDKRGAATEVTPLDKTKAP